MQGPVHPKLETRIHCSGVSLTAAIAKRMFMLNMEVDELARGVEPLSPEIEKDETLGSAYAGLLRKSQEVAETQITLPSTHRAIRALPGRDSSQVNAPTLKALADTEGDTTFNEFLDWIIGDSSRVNAVVNEAPIPYSYLERDEWWEQFWRDHNGGPDMSVQYEALPRSAPLRLFGRDVYSRFGLAAANFAGCSALIAAHANTGFDICTTRTYHFNRSGDAGHSHPRVIPVPVDELNSPRITLPSEVSVDRSWLFDEARRDEAWAIFHSIGAPGSPLISIGNSVSRLARNMLFRENQVLIASIYDEQFGDWAQLAKTVAVCGADAVELNLSLPTRPLGMIAQEGDSEMTGPEKSRVVINTVREALKEIGKPDFPVVAKLGYMDESSLVKWFDECHEGLSGITAINAMKTTALGLSDNRALFESDSEEPDKTNLVGESGDRLGELSREMVTTLNELRERSGRSPDELRIIANGGVRDVDDCVEFCELGADVVQSCSEGYRDRLMAQTIRSEITVKPAATGVYFSDIPAQVQTAVPATFAVRRTKVRQAAVTALHTFFERAAQGGSRTIK